MRTHTRTHPHTHSHIHTHTHTQLLVNADYIHHVVDEHNFEDSYLFFRFRQDGQCFTFPFQNISFPFQNISFPFQNILFPFQNVSIPIFSHNILFHSRTPRVCHAGTLSNIHEGAGGGVDQPAGKKEKSTGLDLLHVCPLSQQLDSLPVQN